MKYTKQSYTLTHQQRTILEQGGINKVISHRQFLLKRQQLVVANLSRR